MIVADLSEKLFQKKISGPGISVKTGPFVVNICSSISSLQKNFFQLYQYHRLANENDFIDFNIKIDRPLNLRRWYRSQAYFYLDGQLPFKPLPYAQAFPMLEWGMNWCISNHAHQYLIIHAAVVEKNGKAILLPAPPGSGKSTACAALVNNGWRLFSDELAMFSTETGELVPLARPVNLKNDSIAVIKDAFPSAIFSEPVSDTNKGTVSLMAAPEESVANSGLRASLKFVVFPRYVASSQLAVEKMNNAVAFMKVVENAFNYSVLGLEAFDLLTKVVDDCDCYNLEYSNLSEMLYFFDELAND